MLTFLMYCRSWTLRIFAVFVLDDRAPPSDVVNMVARIMTGGGAYQNPHELLGTSDIDRYTHTCSVASTHLVFFFPSV